MQRARWRLAMLVKVLEFVTYEDDGWTWQSHEILDPSWEQVEAAIRRLDRFGHPFLFLRLREDVPDDERLDVMGGEGAYWVAGLFGGYFQRRFVNLAGGGDKVRVWTSDQGFADEERFICKDVELVLKVARYFAEHGDFDPSVSWEDQPG
jgi:hypothetical protein